MRTAALGRGLLAGALTLGLLAGCSDGEEPEALPPAVTPEPSPETTEPTTFTAEGKGYSIVFPARPTRSKEQAKSGLRLTYDVYTLRSEDADFSSSRVSYAGNRAPSLREALSSAARQTGGRLASTRTFSYRGQPAVEGTIVGSLASDREAQVTARYVLVDGKILFGLIYRSKVKPSKESKRVRDAFLNSLRFTGGGRD
jgi:hypothetical protein